MTRFGLKETTIRQIQAVFVVHPQVRRAVLYGSRVKGNFRDGSDIDLSLIGKADLTDRVLFCIIDEIDDLLLPYTFDLSIYQQISDPDMIDHIQRVGITFYEEITEAVHN